MTVEQEMIKSSFDILRETQEISSKTLAQTDKKLFSLESIKLRHIHGKNKSNRPLAIDISARPKDAKPSGEVAHGLVSRIPNL